jgi:cation diffusion facilitator CzcD-associated flavoprotein CzcO
MSSDKAATRTRVVIIGAGFGGIGLGIKLRAAALTDFVILERSSRVGGVWSANSYPGAACDIPSHLYSFSFAQKADWPDRYANQQDILAYLTCCVRDHGLEPHLRLGTEVIAARWDEARALWIVETKAGETFEAQSLVSAVGQLSRPLVPNIPGIETFAGPVFHSAEWRHDVDLTGKRVAVIGTGASAIQFVPAIAAQAAALTLFQRSAAYVLPKSDKVYPPWQKALFATMPGALRASRAWHYLRHEATAFAFVIWPAALRTMQAAFLRHMRKGVTDPQKRSKLVPHYRIGCKRLLISNDYFPALNRPNVAIVIETIRAVRPGAIVTADGAEHGADCIVFGTGFTASDFLVPMRITGRAGTDLNHAWSGGAQAHLGITVAGFPNFLMLYGPNTNLAHNSIVTMIESQIRLVIACLKRLARGEIRSLDVKPQVQQHWNARVQERLKRTVWAKGCTSWYLDAQGRNANNWPGFTFEFAWRTRAPKWNDYVVR